MKLSDMPEAEEGDPERKSDGDDDLRRPVLDGIKRVRFRGRAAPTAAREKAAFRQTVERTASKAAGEYATRGGHRH